MINIVAANDLVMQLQLQAQILWLLWRDEINIICKHSGSKICMFLLRLSHCL